MASVNFGTVPRSKIKSYAEDDLGLIGEEVEFFISVMRRVENKSNATVAPDPEMTEQDTDAVGVKGIVKRLAKNKNVRPHKKPRVRYPRP